MSEASQLPFGGAGDSQAGDRPIADRFRRHADSLVRWGRSPLYIHLMGAAADDIDAGGVVARLFAGIPAPPGSVPQLRLMGALHYLVLSGQAPALAAFYPSAGGDRPVDDVWPVAETVMEEQFDQIRDRLHRTVQTNEPGRSAVLFAGLLWLTDRHRRPIRLLEVGASAGLNLLADRYSYMINGHELGDADSPLRFVDPWMPPPPIDLQDAASALRIVARAGCDPSPLNPARADDQLTLLSYIWPDELHRIDRMRAALSVAERDPIPIAARKGSEWLPVALATAGEDDGHGDRDGHGHGDGDGDRDGDGALTVVWHSVMRQYVDGQEWAAIERALDECPSVVRLSMEPTRDQRLGMQLTVHDPAPAPPVTLAACDDHGLPIRWAT